MARGRSRASSDRAKDGEGRQHPVTAKDGEGRQHPVTAKEGEGSPRRGSQSTLYIKNCGELLEYFEEGNVFMRHLIFKRQP